MRERLVLAFSAASTFLVLGWTLWSCRYGFDFTDEGYYLAWMANPFNYKFSTTQFGFVYHPLYQAVAGNIALLRQANILITFALAWAMGVAFLKTAVGETSLRMLPRIVIAASFATTAASVLVFAGTWLPTPSYNSLALQGLLLAATGLMLAESRGSGQSVAGWLLLGLGGWLTFMAKPTTAAALVILVAAYLLLARKLRARWLMVVVVEVLLLLVVSAFVLDGSVGRFFARLEGGVAMPALLGVGIAPSQLLRLGDFDLGSRGRGWLAALAVFIFCAAYLAQVSVKVTASIGACLSSVLAVLGPSTLASPEASFLQIGQFQGLLLFSVPLAILLFAFFTSQSNDLTTIPIGGWALGFALLFLPYAYAFGSGNNYWVIASGGGIFWVFAGLVLLRPLAPKPEFSAVVLSFGLGAQLIVAALVGVGTVTPYRQPQQLRDNDYRIDIGRPGSALLLSRGFGQYVAEAKDVSRRSGFQLNMPVIDLSGRSPGLLYAIGAKNLGQAWTLGGYSGSDKFVEAMFKSVSCKELAVAWVLLEPEGLGRISPGVLSSYGANADADFEVAGAFMTAPGAGSHQIARQQKLLKPVRSIVTATNACASTRGDTP